MPHAPAHARQPFSPRLIAVGLAWLPLWVPAAEPAPAPAPAQVPAPAPQVEVRATGAEQRRADTAGRQTITRDELLRHGDTRLADALQRVPGVSVDGRGQGTELKLGGLGGGYTQLLLNGEPLPRGVALDSIALDSLERVEIVRGATVQSSQAIAGSINLVTRRPTALAARDAKLQLGSQWGLPQVVATLNLGDSAGRATWGLGLVLSREHQRWPATIVQSRREGDNDSGMLTQRVRTDKREEDRTDAISLNPRLAWRHEQGGGLTLLSMDHSLRLADSSGGVLDQRTPLLGPAPAQQVSDMALNYRRLFWRGRLQAQRREADGTQTEARLNMSYASRDQQARVLGRNFSSALVQDTEVDGLAVDQSAVFNLNHQRPLGEAHRLDLGAEWEQARRREDRVQTEQPLVGGLPPENLDERFNASVQRWALYLQDEWSPQPSTTLQLGLRVEQLSTLSEGNVFERVRQSHRLVGPVLRLSLRPGPGPGTFKLGLSRGFKLPAPRDVMPRRYVPVEVSPTSPAQSGNPALRPERAWSLDGSWHDKLAALGGDLVLSASLRQIDDLMLDRLIHQPAVLTAPWLLQRFNGGRAWQAGLELALQGQAAHALLGGAPLRWRSSLALARSRLVDVAAERPALVGLAPWQFKLDLTQALAPRWTATWGLESRGAALADQPSGRRFEHLGGHRMSASLAWQPQPRQTWRLSVDQLGATDAVDLKTVQVLEAQGLVSYASRDTWHRAPVWRLGFESGF